MESALVKVFDVILVSIDHSFVIFDVFAAFNIALLLEWLKSVRRLRPRPPANSHHSVGSYTIRVLSSILPKRITVSEFLGDRSSDQSCLQQASG